MIHKEEGRLEDAIASLRARACAGARVRHRRNNLAIALTEMGTRVKLAGGRSILPPCHVSHHPCCWLILSQPACCLQLRA